MRRIAYAVLLMVSGLCIAALVIGANAYLDILLVIALVFALLFFAGKSQPVEIQSIDAQLEEMRAYVNHQQQLKPALHATVYPIELDSFKYEFVVRNVSEVDLRDVVIDFFDVLGPDDFGLDPTHMPGSMTYEPKFKVALLSPNQSRSIALAKWGKLADYKGSLDLRVVAGFTYDGGGF
jgi:hypothetical protein